MMKIAKGLPHEFVSGNLLNYHAYTREFYPVKFMSLERTNDSKRIISSELDNPPKRVCKETLDYPSSDNGDGLLITLFYSQ